MVEFRPSTWALLGVMCLLIFTPLFFLNLDGVTDTAPGAGDNKIVPAMTGPGPVPDRGRGNRAESVQPPANRTPPTNQPDGNSIDPN